MHNLDSFQKLCEKALLGSCAVNDLQDFLIIQTKKRSKFYLRKMRAESVN